MGRVAADHLEGRDGDLAVLRRFVDEASERGGVLLLSGEPGVGKTALLDAAAAYAASIGARVLRAAGAEFEAEMSFSGLNLVLHPLLSDLSALAPLHREALSVALGLEAGTPSDRLVVSNATLALLRHAAKDCPLLLLVDDLLWFDRASASVLASTVRRLPGTRVGFLGAMRAEAVTFFDRAGLPNHRVEPLDRFAATALLAQEFPALSPEVRERLVTDAQGNPLALLELPIALRDNPSPPGHVPAVLPLTERLQDLFTSRVRALPEHTIYLLLLAVLDGSGELGVLEGCAPSGAGLEDFAPAERAHVVHVDDASRRLAFRHPLIRSAVFALSTSEQRREAHRALAECAPDPERRAWHLSEATVRPDEAVASLLQVVAHRHLNRGDAVRAVRDLLRAAELSPAAPDRSRRLAEAAYIGAMCLGNIRDAPQLLADVRMIDPSDGGSLAEAVAAAYHLLNGDGDFDTAHRLLVGAIETAPDPTDARDEVLVEAIYNLLEVCHFGNRADAWPPFYRAVARLKPGAPEFLQLLAKTLPDPARDAVPALDQLDAAVANIGHDLNPSRIVRLAVASAYVDRLPRCRPALWRVVQEGQAGGAVAMSIQAMALLGFDAFLTGQWDSLAKLADEAIALCDTQGYGLLRWVPRSLQALLAAARGDSESATAIANEVTNWAVPRRAGEILTYALHARALDAMGRGNFQEGYENASRVSPAGTIASHVPHAMWMVLNLVESAIRSGHDDEAIAHVAAAQGAGLPVISPRLALITLGAEAVTTADDQCAIQRFEQALAVPGVVQWPFDLARVQLLFGERLRRARATTRARQLLSAARDAFQQLEARPWARRADGELRATGITIGKTGLFGANSLTPQQLEIAQLAAAGLTNKEIGERLFLSHRTVSTHLYQIFPKLGVTSRAALRDALKELPNEV